MNSKNKQVSKTVFMKQLLSRPKRDTSPKKLSKSPTEKLLDHRLPTFHIKKHSLVFKNESEEETQRHHVESREKNKRGRSIFYDDLESSKKKSTNEHNSRKKSSKKDFVDTFCENTFRQKSKKQQFTFKKSTQLWAKSSNPKLLSLDSREINNFRSSENSDKLLTSKREGSKQRKGEVYDNIVLSIRDISQSRSSRTSINRDTLRSHRRLKIKDQEGFGNNSLFEKICKEEAELYGHKHAQKRLGLVPKEQKRGNRNEVIKVGNRFSFEGKRESEKSKRSSRSGSWRNNFLMGNRKNSRNVNVSDYLKIEKKKDVKLEKKRKKKLSIETRNPHIGNQTWNSHKRLSEEFVTKNNFTFKSKKKIIYDEFGAGNKGISGKKRKIRDMRPNFVNTAKNIGVRSPSEMISKYLPDSMSKTLENDQLRGISKTRERFFSTTYENSEKRNMGVKKKESLSHVDCSRWNNTGKSIILSIKDLTPKQNQSMHMKKQQLKKLLLSNDKSTPCFEKCLSTKSIQKTPKIRPKQLFKSTKKMRKQVHSLKESAQKMISNDPKPINLIVYSRSKKKQEAQRNFGTIKKRTSRERLNLKKKGIHSKRISSMLQNVEQSNKEIYSRLKQFENDYRNLTTGSAKPGIYNPSFLVKKDVFPKHFEREIEKINLDFQKKEKGSKETLHRETDLMNSSDLLSNRSNKIFTWAPKSNENSQILNSLINNIPITESYKAKEFHQQSIPKSLKIEKISNYSYNHNQCLGQNLKPKGRYEPKYSQNPRKNPKMQLRGKLKIQKFSKFPIPSKDFSKILSHRKNNACKLPRYKAKENEVELVSKENELRKLLRKNRRTPKSKIIKLPKENLFSDVKFSQMDWMRKKKQFSSYNKYASLNKPKKVGYQKKNESLYHCISPLMHGSKVNKKKAKKDCICCSNWRYNFNNFLHKKF